MLKTIKIFLSPVIAMRILSITLCCVACSGPAFLASAGSSVRVNLETLDSVKVEVPTGGLQYKTPETLDPSALESAIILKSSERLAEKGIKVSPHSGQELIIDVGFVRRLEAKGILLLVVRVSLEEEAMLKREEGLLTEDRYRWVTTWSDESIREAKLDNLHHQIVEEAAAIVEEFSSKTRQAKTLQASAKNP